MLKGSQGHGLVSLIMDKASKKSSVYVISECLCNRDLEPVQLYQMLCPKLSSDSTSWCFTENGHIVHASA